MRILVTGAAGRLGSAAVEQLDGSGHEVVATDAVYSRALPVPVRVVDLLDEHAVYGLFEGVEAVLHLGNHPNGNGRAPRQRLLSENVAMTANVLYAAVGVGVPRVVYASSVQATLNLGTWPDWRHPPTPCPFPRLPMDGHAPVRTGSSPYGISKAHGEHLLRELCLADPGLSGVALRLPGVSGDRGWTPPRRPFTASFWALHEGLGMLHIADAARLFEAALLRSPPGYRCHFPAACRAVAGIGPEGIAREYLGHVPVEGDLRGPGGLVSLAELEEELGWTPLEPTPLLWPEEDPPTVG